MSFKEIVDDARRTTHDGRRTTHDDGRNMMAIGHHDHRSGDLKMLLTLAISVLNSKQPLTFESMTSKFVKNSRPISPYIFPIHKLIQKAMKTGHFRT